MLERRSKEKVHEIEAQPCANLCGRTCNSKRLSDGFCAPLTMGQALQCASLPPVRCAKLPPQCATNIGTLTNQTAPVVRLKERAPRIRGARKSVAGGQVSHL